MAWNNLHIPLVIYIAALSFGGGEKICPQTQNEYANYLGTKTPYRIVANYNVSEIKYEGCAARKMWGLIRHGTRNPSVKLIDKMRTRLVEVRDLVLENLLGATDEISNLDLDVFRSWAAKVKPKNEKRLTHEGEDEMIFLAERLQGRFPSVLSTTYSESAFKFKFTATQRTQKSAKAFATGLFGRNVAKDVDFPEPLQKDPILRFYKLCDKWRREVKKNPAALGELKKFQESAKMAETIGNVNSRLGFNNSELDLSDVHAMYMTCAFETAWNKRRRSPWCSAFSTDDIKVLEYAEDLKYYWIDGYGYELTYKQACRAVDDMIHFLQNDETHPKASLYFTHSGTLLKMLAHMELYKEEEHLEAKDFEEKSDRKWKVSYIDTFGNNLIFVLYDCQGRKEVLTLHQERIVRLPTCSETDLCDFDRFVSYYGSSECLFDQMCATTA